MKWKILNSGKAEAKKNMILDAQLLEKVEEEPILHLYDWANPSVTFGHFIDPFKFLRKEGIEKNRLDLAKRPTGGGILFHTCDFAFSMIIPKSHPAYSVNVLNNYRFVNQIITEVIASFMGKKRELHFLDTEPIPLDEHSRHFCMAKPTKYDVIFDRRKVGGGAQRKTKLGFLHQGTISLSIPGDKFLDEVLHSGTCVIDSMKNHSFYLLGKNCSFKQLQDGRRELSELLTKGVSKKDL